jgi:adenine-specific DNA methylase
MEKLHHIGPSNIDLRDSMIKFIGAFSNWDASIENTFLGIARGLVKAAYPDEPPLVVDPFAGGGSIPLEALRVGGEAFAGDLNPVACLILKAKLEYLAKNLDLPKELEEVGASVTKSTRKELAGFYPSDPDGSQPIAYIWARTVRCESPNCGAEIPLIRSFWLSKKASRRRALRYQVHHSSGRTPVVVFEIFEPKSEKEVPGGTVSRAKAVCPCCGAVLGPERVRAQLEEQRGGADVIFDNAGTRAGGARLLAVVTLQTCQSGRNYRLAPKRDYDAIWEANKRLESILIEWEHNGKREVCPIPMNLCPQLARWDSEFSATACYVGATYLP